jgi:hypothetical protein
VDDRAAQVEDRQREQVTLDEKQQVQHPSGAAVAIGDGCMASNW